MDKEALYQQLENYLNNQLAPTERAALQRQIDSDEAVASELELLRLEKELAGLLVDNELEEKMATWGKAQTTIGQQHPTDTILPGDPQPQKPRRINLWVTGLLILILMGMLCYYFFFLKVAGGGEATRNHPPTTPPPTQLVPTTEPQEQAPPAPLELPSSPPIASTTVDVVRENQLLALAEAGNNSPVEQVIIQENRAIDASSENPIEQAVIRLKNKDFEGASNLLRNVPKAPDEELYKNARQYLAYIYFAEKKYLMAIPILEQLIADGYGYGMEKMQWYLALAYLATQQQGKGEALLNKVARNSKDSNLATKAQAFLQTLYK